MKRISFVGEGPTDHLVVEALLNEWASEETIVTRIQPPTSDAFVGLVPNLSHGWKGVLAWLAPGHNAVHELTRANAEVFILHMDAEVGAEAQFPGGPDLSPCPPAGRIRAHLTDVMPTPLRDIALLCIPAQDLEAWVLTALYLAISDRNAPIECAPKPAHHLATLPARERLARFNDGDLKKQRPRYEERLPEIVAGWHHCTDGDAPRCPEAVRFEAEARAVL